VARVVDRPVEKVVAHVDFVPRVQQLAGEMRAKESSASCDEKSRHG
jgi:hypothetical protein